MSVTMTGIRAEKPCWAMREARTNDCTLYVQCFAEGLEPPVHSLDGTGKTSNISTNGYLPTVGPKAILTIKNLESRFRASIDQDGRQEVVDYKM